MKSNNDNVRDEVLWELNWDPKISSKDITTQVSDGIVTLSGFVPTYWEKKEAEEAVKRVYGVRAVANDIQVKLAAERSDPQIARDAVGCLESNVGVPYDQIKVTVKDRWVTLEGIVEWQYQKNAVESAIERLKGVAGVINKITLAQRVSPGDVKRRIEDALRRSAQLDARRIRVEVEGGIVKLYGSVSSWSEKGDAERAAWSAPGTWMVENHIAITP